jgi:MOSC domain-containing protein YiiM
MPMGVGRERPSHAVRPHRSLPGWIESPTAARDAGSPFRAGVMAIVSEGGEIFPGDPIRAVLPESPRLTLLPL